MAQRIPRIQSHLTVHTCGKKFMTLNKECAFAFALKLIALAFRAQDWLSRSVAMPTISGGSRDRIASRNCWDSISAIPASV